MKLMAKRFAQIVPGHDTDGEGQQPRAKNANNPALASFYQPKSIKMESICSKLRERSTWSDAVVIVMLVILNSLTGVAIAIAVNYIFTFGNFFSGRSPDQQSFAEFSSACMGLSTVFVSVSMLCLQATLQIEHEQSGSKFMTFVRCFIRLLRIVSPRLALSLVFAVTVSYTITIASPGMAKYKLHFYVGGWLMNTHLIGLSNIVKRLQHPALSVRPTSDGKRCLQKIFNHLLALAPVYLCAGAIHYISVHILHGHANTLACTLVGVFVKLLMQECAKHYVVTAESSDLKLSYVAVGLPTVLIDTQVRMVLLHASSGNPTTLSSWSAQGSALLSLFEIAARFGKIVLIRFGIRTHHRKVTKRLSETLSQMSASRRLSSCHDARGSQGSQVSLTRQNSMSPRHKSIFTRQAPATTIEEMKMEFVQWRHRTLHFHAAEIHAHMYAETMAIGCSMSLYYFFRCHAKYRLDCATALSSNEEWSLSLHRQAATLLVQITLQAVTDFVCCVMEIVNGIPHNGSRHLGKFIAALSINCAVINIVLSADLYVSGE
ncbi:TPA: hypothetical protein N0F65_006036 [Lagenidium giganteum]|uniref:Gustatory receptor n=1 Tax=Lagenidium giganteum TaxID=4803 RepID=A0AAV2Z3E3_9STRA|nr:TPA: hypothetical protein N0F65_006036 [Lagenidium giganteum]